MADQETTPTNGAVKVAQAIERLEAETRTAATLATKFWLRSEWEALRDSFLASKDGQGLADLTSEIERAKQDGRFYDDRALTVANLRAKHGDAVVILSRGDIQIMQSLCASLMATGSKPGSNVSPKYRDAASQWHNELGRLGRLAAETPLGVVIADLLPTWAQSSWGYGQVMLAHAQVVSADDPRVSEAMLRLQGQRWREIESLWPRILLRIADGGEIPIAETVPTWDEWQVGGGGKFEKIPQRPPSKALERMRALGLL